MGRGRAKAKQTKVARDLKYRTLDTDFDQLQRELHGEPSGTRTDDAEEESSDPVDEYADYGDRGTR